MTLDVNQVIDVLVNEKRVPAKIDKNKVYLLHWTIPDEDGMAGANRTSIRLFKTLKGVAKYILSECFIDSVQELRDYFQNDCEENSYVWDVIIEKVEK